MARTAAIMQLWPDLVGRTDPHSGPILPLAAAYAPDGQRCTDIVRAGYQLVEAYPGPDGRPLKVAPEALALVRWRRRHRTDQRAISSVT